ncbi:MAG: hypothetical protein R2742_10150 [Micropruina glycogenica]
MFDVVEGEVLLRERLRVSAGSLSGLGVLADGTAAIVSLRDEQGAAVLDLTGPDVTVLPERLATGVSPYVVDVDAAAHWAVIGSVGWGGKAFKSGSSVADADLISLVDTSARPFRTVDHAAVPSIPEGVAISPDGGWVVALCMAGSQVPADAPAPARPAAWSCSPTTTAGCAGSTGSRPGPPLRAWSSAATRGASWLSCAPTAASPSTRCRASH